MDFGKNVREEAHQHSRPNALLLAHQEGFFESFEVIFGNGKNHLIDHVPAEQFGKLVEIVSRIGPAKPGAVHLGSRLRCGTDTRKTEQPHAAIFVTLNDTRDLKRLWRLAYHKNMPVLPE